MTDTTADSIAPTPDQIQRARAWVARHYPRAGYRSREVYVEIALGVIERMDREGQTRFE